MTYRIHPIFRTARRLAAVIALGLIDSPSAQIGSKWIEYFPKKELQQENSEGYSTYQDVGGLETFTLLKNPKGSRQRCEIRVRDDYNSGTTQFEGEFLMLGGGGPGTAIGDEVSIMQVWLSLIVAVSDRDGGSIWFGAQNKLLDHLYGRWIRLNVYHDADKKTCQVWFDGVKKEESQTKFSSPYYHKYGLYHSLSSHQAIQWRNVRFFKGGSMAGGGTVIRSPSISPSAGLRAFEYVDLRGRISPSRAAFVSSRPEQTLFRIYP